LSCQVPEKARRPIRFAGFFYLPIWYVKIANKEG
jgi:hypothetical protein